MTKNTQGGKKKRRGKNIAEPELKVVEAQEEQYYGKIVNILGNGRFHVDVYIPETIVKNKEKEEQKEAYIINNLLCIMRGNMRKRNWINKDGIVLVTLRDYEKEKADIVYSYSQEQIVKLKQKKKLPNSTIFETDISSEVMFDKDDSDDEINEMLLERNKKIKETSYLSNYDLIPDIKNDSYSE
jgi:translation initiation factor 1A